MSRFGSRDIHNVVIKEITTGKPVLYLETLTTSTTEVTAETVHARGGRGNPILISWDSDKEVVYNMQDALISPESLALLTGSELTKGSKPAHKKEVLTITESNGDLVVELTKSPSIGSNLFIFKTKHGYDIGEELTSDDFSITDNIITFTGNVQAGDKIIVDYYFDAPMTTKSITITADKFPGYYMLEGETLWRRESDGKDLPALYTMPKIKIQPNFTIENAAAGEPAVFDFNVIAYPSGENRQMVIIDVLED